MEFLRHYFFTFELVNNFHSEFWKGKLPVSNFHFVINKKGSFLSCPAQSWTFSFIKNNCNFLFWKGESSWRNVVYCDMLYTVIRLCLSYFSFDIESLPWKGARLKDVKLAKCSDNNFDDHVESILIYHSKINVFSYLNLLWKNNSSVSKSNVMLFYKLMLYRFIFLILFDKKFDNFSFLAKVLPNGKDKNK